MKRWLTDAAAHAVAAPGPALRAAHIGAAAPDGPAVTELTAWLARLRLLHGVPFHYLVPDARMLPVESLRFFQVDPNWLTALLDGAFSVGRAASAEPAAARGARRGTGPAADPEADRGADLLARATAHAPQVRAGHLGRLGRPLLRQARPGSVPPAMSGFVLRSGVVSGWPSLEVLARDTAGAPLTILRLERLAEDVLLALFAGVVRSVMFRAPAEALHFGVEPAAPGQPLRKTLRYLDGTGHEPGAPLPNAAVEVPLRSSALGVVDVAGLQAAVRAELLARRALRPTDPYAAGHFALEMVQGVQQVEFTVEPAAPAPAP